MTAIPVICDRCRAAGSSGDPPFADFGDLLDFAPVPRRPRVGGWSPDVQRAFIAALAVTGSARQSAAAVGRAQYGVEQLRNAKASEGFNAAYDRALAIAEEKGRHRLAAGVAALVRADASALPPPVETAESDNTSPLKVLAPTTAELRFPRGGFLRLCVVESGADLPPLQYLSASE